MAGILQRTMVSNVVVDLDHEHDHYALVCGPDESYLWILARTPAMDLKTLIGKAATLGFDPTQLIIIDHH